MCNRGIIALTAVLITVTAAYVNSDEYDPECDWEPDGSISANCVGTTNHCFHGGCGVTCSIPLSGVEYADPKLIKSGGDARKSKNQVDLPCKYNQVCATVSVGSRKCGIVTLPSGIQAPQCGSVDVTQACMYCGVSSYTTIYVSGYALAPCPAG